jgi:mRNA export factor
MEVMMPERVYAMDVRGQTMVVGCGGQEKKLALLHMSNPGVVQRLQDSPLKFQTRCVRVFHDQRFFAVTSIEGRCAIRCVNEADDKATEPSNPAKSRFAFAFKCHRDDKYIYSVNAIDCQPKSQYHSVFATGGSDGVYTFWDKDKRQRLKEFPRGNRTPVVDVKYNPGGDLCAYAYSYDWSKGAENYNPQAMPPQIMVHTVKEDGELFRR